MRPSRGPGVVPVGGIFTGESGSTLSDEIDFRMRRLEMEAASERAVRPPDGSSRHVAIVGSAIRALRRLHVRQHLPLHHGHRL
jgi:hypothetical protein